MSDEAVVATPPKRKRPLPFKATALRRNAPTQGDKKSLDDDGLSLFQRREEVLPAFEEEAKRAAREREARKSSITPKKEQKWQPTSDFSENRKRRDPVEEDNTEAAKQSTVANGKPDVPGDGSPRATKRTKSESESPSIKLKPLPSITSLTGGDTEEPPHNDGSFGSNIDEERTSPQPSRASKGKMRADTISLESDTEPESTPLPPMADDDDLVLMEEHASATKHTQEVARDDDDIVIVDEPPAAALPDWMAKYAKESRAKQIAPKPRTAEICFSDTLLTPAAPTTDDGTTYNPEIIITVTSPIPGSKPHHIKRRALQTLRLVREVWIHQHRVNHHLDIPPEYEDRIFLTYKGEKIYGSTTLRSLGVGVAPPLPPGPSDGAKPSLERVALEMWDEELYEEERARRERERRRRLGSGSEDDEGLSNGEPEAVEEVVKLRVTLQAKDREPVRAKVQEDTTVETLVNYFRSQCRIPPAQTVTLMFEGEMLDEHVTVGEADIADLDCIDVLVK